MNNTDKENSLPVLTPREEEVFQLLLRGMTAKEMAGQLYISTSGVNYFVKRIYKKLGVRSKSELILRYYDFHKDKASENVPP